MKENTSYKVKNTTINRLAEMGFIKGTVFIIIKKVAGMLQIRFNGSDIIIREETEKDIDYEE